MCVCFEWSGVCMSESRPIGAHGSMEGPRPCCVPPEVPNRPANTLFRLFLGIQELGVLKFEAVLRALGSAIRQFYRISVFGVFAAICVCLQALGKQQIFWVPQILRNRNRGKKSNQREGLEPRHRSRTASPWILSPNPKPQTLKIRVVRAGPTGRLSRKCI